MAVRVRPFNEREINLKSTCVIEMEGKTTKVLGNNPKTFTYDYSYWSNNPADANFASQDTVYNDIGTVVLANALDGFNGCLFAYGQTGSGKSYSVMGYPNAKGIIPRSVEEIFKRKGELESGGGCELRIWISFVEIYNEQVRDLLHAGTDHDHGELKIMDHPKLGVYIPGLTEAACGAPEDVDRLMDFGTKKRVVASTAMNATSSRSHAVFTVKVQNLEGKPPENDSKDERKALNAKINLVDLAGSERQSKTGAEGATLKEGCAINQSLSALGMVIKELSEAVGKKGATIPFRASKLTFLLKNSLSGNSKTYMIAAISPSSDNVEETVSTLRFASSVKMIKTVAVQNKDKKDELIEHLQEELKKLKEQMGDAPLHPDSHQMKSIEERERLLTSMGKSFDQEVAENKEMSEAREEVLKDSGLSQDSLQKSLGMKKDAPFFMNMAEDPLLAGCLIYFIKENEVTTIGAAEDCTIRLKGIGIPDNLCVIENEGNLTLHISRSHSEIGRVVVNGKLLKEDERLQLHNSDKLYLGRAYALKLSLPNESSGEHHSLSLDGLGDECAALEDSPSWKSLQMYLDSVLMQMDEQEGRELFTSVKEGCKLCDEANEISTECRPEEAVRFEVDLTTSIPTSAVVRVWQHTDSNGDDSTGTWRQVYFWSVPQMAERLDRMRDCYQSFTVTGMCIVDALADPWHESRHEDITARVTELERLLLEAREEAEKLKYEKQNAINRTMMIWKSERSGSQLLQSIFLAWKNTYSVTLSKKETVEKMPNSKREVSTKQAPKKLAANGSRKFSANATKQGANATTPQVGRGSKGSLKGVSKPDTGAGGSQSASTPLEASGTTTSTQKDAFASNSDPPCSGSMSSEQKPEIEQNLQPAVECSASAAESSKMEAAFTLTPIVKEPNNYQLTAETHGNSLGSDELYKDLEMTRVQALARESEALKKQLDAAWELCRTLQSRVKDQEELREKDHEELKRHGLLPHTHHEFSEGLHVVRRLHVERHLSSPSTAPAHAINQINPIGFAPGKILLERAVPLTRSPNDGYPHTPMTPDPHHHHEPAPQFPQLRGRSMSPMPPAPAGFVRPPQYIVPPGATVAPAVYNMLDASARSPTGTGTPRAGTGRWSTNRGGIRTPLSNGQVRYTPREDSVHRS